MYISARNKYIVKVSMVKYTQINAYLAKKSPDTQTKAKIPRSSEKYPAVATLQMMVGADGYITQSQLIFISAIASM